MATHKSAEKRHRQNLKRREQNRQARSTIRTEIKKSLSLSAAGKREEALSAAKTATSLLDKAVAHGVMHKNTASRTISRLQVRVNTAA